MLKNNNINQEGIFSILEKVQGGCESSFRILFDMYRPNIYTTSLRLTNDSSIAEDVVQEVFLKIWMNRKALLEIRDFEKWLYVVSKNLTLNLLRKQKNQTVYEREIREIANSSYFAADYLIKDKEYQNILRQAIDRLPPKQKETYFLIKERYLKRMEAAEILKVSPETVKWNLNEAMKSIRAYCIARLNDFPFLLISLSHFLINFF